MHIADKLAPSRHQCVNLTMSGTSPNDASDSDEPRALGRAPPLIERISNQLSRDILGGRYQPGDRIRETEVAARLNVSRAPVREALLALEQDGLVEVIPWRGARVIDPSLKEVLAIFDLLAAVFGVVARLAAENASDEEIRHWADHIDQLEGIVDNGEMVHMIDAVYRAGTLIGHVCGSPRAGGALYRIGKTAYWLHRFLLPAPMRWRRQILARYRKLQTHLEQRDGVKAERAAIQIVRHSHRWIERNHPDAREK